MAIETLGGTDKLIEHVKEHVCNEDLDLIKQACAFAETYYAKIDHPTGKPYIEYASEVAINLANFHFDAVVISAAILYPPPPVSDTVLIDLRNSFKHVSGLFKLVEEILLLCHFEWNVWPTTLEQHNSKERKDILQRMFLLTIDEEKSEGQGPQSPTDASFQTKEKQVENLIRMLLVLTSDIRALIIKLVDRLYFIKILKDLPQHQQKALNYTQFAQVTLALYAPLADRLGMWQLKSELEDMSFRLLQPTRYMAIANLLATKKREREDYINHTIIPNLKNVLEGFDIKAEISGRAKHIYSIHQKMEAKRLAFEHINDLLGIRIIVDTIRDCYAAQETIHAFWSPITDFYGGEPGRDWIDQPKQNQYQSLHTTIRFNDYNGTKKLDRSIR